VFFEHVEMLRNDEEASLLENSDVGMVDDFYKGCFRDDFYVSLLSAKWLNAKSPVSKKYDQLWWMRINTSFL